MLELSSTTLVLLGFALALVLGLQIITAIILAVQLRLAGRDQRELHKEMFGLLKKIEGLNYQKREQVLQEFDQVIEILSSRLPSTVAAKASSAIIEAESKILTRLAELEPNLKEDENSQQKMNELIQSMEHLEETLVRLTTDTVEQVMAESRKNIFEMTNPTQLTQ